MIIIIIEVGLEMETYEELLPPFLFDADEDREGSYSSIPAIKRGFYIHEMISSSGLLLFAPHENVINSHLIPASRQQVDFHFERRALLCSLPLLISATFTLAGVTKDLFIRKRKLSPERRKKRKGGVRNPSTPRPFNILTSNERIKSLARIELSALVAARPRK